LRSKQLATAQPAAGAFGAPHTDVLRGIMFMLASAILFPVMNAAAKWLTDEYNTVEIVWARNLGHLLFLVLLFAPARGFAALVRTTRPALQLTRSLLFVGGNLLFFSAIGHLPLALASAITFTAPFIVTALSVPMLGEKVGPRRWAAVVVGFAGALVVIRPGLGEVHWSVLLLIANAASYALYQILTRRVATHDRPETSAFYSALLGSVALCLAVPFFWHMPGSVWEVVVLSSLGVLGGLGHYCVARAFMWGPASVLSPFNYAQLIGAAILGYLIFDNVPDRWVWLDAAIIVASGLYIAYRERRVRQV